MDIEIKRIAVLCDYKLMPDRIGGMDYFFWQFDASCKTQNIALDWFFPNSGNHGGYGKFNIIASDGESIESLFLDHLQNKNISYSHVITHFLEICTPFYKHVKKILPAKIIAVDHNPRPLNGYPVKKKIIKRIKGILYAKYIDLFVGVSQNMVKELLQDFGMQINTKIVVIHNGLLIENFKIKKSYRKPISFIVACHLRESKGIQDLIKAVYNLPKKLQKTINVDIYGEGPYEQFLKDMTKLWLLDNTVNFKGSVSNLPHQFYKYDLLIHPSHAETFCYTVLESLICRVPVITTKNIGNVLEIVVEGKNGYLFEARNVVQLSTLLKDIVEKEEIINCNTPKDLAEKFSIENMLNNYLKLLN